MNDLRGQRDSLAVRQTQRYLDLLEYLRGPVRYREQAPFADIPGNDIDGRVTAG